VDKSSSGPHSVRWRTATGAKARPATRRAAKAQWVPLLRPSKPSRTANHRRRGQPESRHVEPSLTTRLLLGTNSSTRLMPTYSERHIHGRDGDFTDLRCLEYFAHTLGDAAPRANGFTECLR